MEVIYVVIAAVIQGLTEFLPVSSSAHLILLPALSGMHDQGLPTDIAVHAGSLLAVMLYFRKELYFMVRDLLNQWFLRKGPTPYTKMAWLLVMATIPVCVVGLFLYDYIAEYFRSALVIGFMSIIFGIILGWADRRPDGESELLRVTWKQAFWVGIFQILSLIPGASRSGTTITAARFMGLNREISAKFSFLLSIPVILAATVLESYKVVKHDVAFNWFDLQLGFVVSAVLALVVIHFFIKLIERVGMMPFVIYRVLLGAVLIYVFW